MLVGVLANAHLVGLFHAPPRSESKPPTARWAEKWGFTPHTLGGFSWRQLAPWSLQALFLELAMIRWISSEIPIFAYFKNFVLIACFLGFGLGCCLSRRPINLLPMIVPLLVLALIVKLPWESLRTLMSSIPTFIGASSEVQVWGVPPPSFPLPMLAVAIAIIVPIFSLICFVFIPLGQLVHLQDLKIFGGLAVSVHDSQRSGLPLIMAALGFGDVVGPSCIP